MKSRVLPIVMTVTLLASVSTAWFFRAETAGDRLTVAAKAFVRSLDDKQRKKVLMKYDSKERVGWHFIPKDSRKGLQMKHMTDEQRGLALKLLQSGLSEAGFGKAKTIMALEGVLHELEKGKGRNIRDTERYYYTIFGEPSDTSRWGLSIEGHHLSLNFVIDKNKVISSTPAFFAANPGEVKAAVPNTKIKKGTRVLADEEVLAFKLVNSLTDEQKKTAVLAKKARREIRGAGEAQPPQEKSAGIAAPDLNEDQQRILRQLVGAYLKNFPGDIASGRVAAIREAGPDSIHFAWEGALKPGIGHYYRIEGPTFVIEFVNTQPDAAGNRANHIHCVWRDMRGDFALPIKKSTP